MNSRLSSFEIWSRSRFEPVSESIINCYFWGFPTYVLEPKLHKPGVKITKWSPNSCREVNKGFRKMYSTQVGLVLNLFILYQEGDAELYDEWLTAEEQLTRFG